jgi:hypothetical protein
METEQPTPFDTLPKEQGEPIDAAQPRSHPRLEYVATRPKSKSDVSKSSRLWQSITASREDELEEAKDVIEELPTEASVFESERKKDSPRSANPSDEDISEIAEAKRTPSVMASREHSYSDLEDTSTPVIKRKIGTFIKKHFPKINHEDKSNQVTAGKPAITVKDVMGGLDSSTRSLPNNDRPSESTPERSRSSRIIHSLDIQMDRVNFGDSPLSPSLENSCDCELLDVKSQTDIRETTSPQDSDRSNEKVEEEEREEERDSEWHFPRLTINKRIHKQHAENVDHLTHSRQASSKRPSRSNSFTQKILASLDLSRQNSEASLSEKYGKRESVVGKGAHATVRLAHKREKDAKWFAIKEFRKKKKEESEKDYIKKLIAEFCIRYICLI